MHAEYEITNLANILAGEVIRPEALRGGFGREIDFPFVAWVARLDGGIGENPGVSWGSSELDVVGANGAIDNDRTHTAKLIGVTARQLPSVISKIHDAP